MTKVIKLKRPCPFCGKKMELHFRIGASQILHREGQGPVCRITCQVHSWHEDVAAAEWESGMEKPAPGE